MSTLEFCKCVSMSVSVPGLVDEADFSRQEITVVTNITMAQNTAIKNTYNILTVASAAMFKDW